MGPDDKLRSAAAPLLQPRSSMFAVAAERALTAPPRRPTQLGRPILADFVAWSAAEPLAGIYVERGVLDPFRPVNFTISAILAAVGAGLNEATRTGLIPSDLDRVLGADDEMSDEEQEPLPVDWKLTRTNFYTLLSKDVLSGVLQRSGECLAKPRVPTVFHQEMLKHVPKFTRYQYRSHCNECSSKLIACARTSKAILKSPVFFVFRSSCFFLADIAVDYIRSKLGDLSPSALRQNVSLKAIKYSVSAVFCLVLGAVVPFIYAHPYLFILTDLGANTAADMVVSASSEASIE